MRFLFGHRVERRLASVLTGALELGSNDLPGTPALATWLFFAACLIAMFPHLPASLTRRPRKSATTVLLAVGAWIVFWLLWPVFLHVLGIFAPLTQTTQCMLVILGSITALIVSLNHTGDVTVLQLIRNGVDSLVTLDACNVNSSNGYAWPSEDKFNASHQRWHINRSSSNSNCDNYRSKSTPRKSRAQITPRNRSLSVKHSRISTNKRTKACQGKNSDRQRNGSSRPNQRQSSPARKNKANESLRFTWLSQKRPQKGRSPERVGTKRKLTHGPGKQPRQKPPAKRPRLAGSASKKRRCEPHKQIPKTARLGDNCNMSNAAKYVYAGSTPHAAANTSDAGSTPYAASTPDAANAPDAVSTHYAGSTPYAANDPDTASTPDAGSTPYAANAPDTAGTPHAGSTPYVESTPNAASTQNTGNTPYLGNALRASTPICSLQTVTSPADVTQARRSQATSTEQPLSTIVRVRDETTSTLADAEPPPRKRPKLDSNVDYDRSKATSTRTPQPARRRRHARDQPDDKQKRSKERAKKTSAKHKDRRNNTSPVKLKMGVDGSKRKKQKPTCHKSSSPPPYTPPPEMPSPPSYPPSTPHPQSPPYLTSTYVPYPQPYYVSSQQSGRTTFPSSYIYEMHPQV